MTHTLRAYRVSDEEDAIALWQRAWQVAYPQIAFAKRTEWWRARWRDDLVPVATIIMLEQDEALTGFVTIDRKTGYLDQLVIAPEVWGQGLASLLIDEAKRLSPHRIDLHVNRDNERAIRLYEKCEFVISGNDVNPHSGAPVYKMTWQPG